MATQQQIDDAVAAAEAYAATKLANENALGALQRAQAVIDATNVLIERLSSDGGADSNFWAALMTGIDTLKVEQAARTQTYSDAYTAMNTAKGELDAAIAALGTGSPLGRALAAIADLEEPKARADEVDVDVEEIAKPTEHHKPAPVHHHKASPPPRKK